MKERDDAHARELEVEKEKTAHALAELAAAKAAAAASRDERLAPIFRRGRGGAEAYCI